jgi:hypothetical protein
MEKHVVSKALRGHSTHDPHHIIANVGGTSGVNKTLAKIGHGTADKAEKIVKKSE